ncbi:hypothetical protein Tco_1192664 [Tanacetum coccineum]
MESQSETTQTVSALKLPILKTGDYDLWSMRMEQYLTHDLCLDHAPDALCRCLNGALIGLFLCFTGSLEIS